MLFNFKLRPLEAVTPWYRDGQPFLHWFGLTDGWYWLDVATATLFQYTDVVLDHWEIPLADEPYRCYVDYHVVRLWEDLQERLPHILEPIPHRVLQRIQPGYQAVLWRNAVADCLIPDDADVPASAFVRLEQATEWLTNRWLDVGYLRAGPRIWFWNDGESAYIHWDNQALKIDNIPVWTATQGTLTLPLTALIDEIRSFDERLIQAMHERVSIAQKRWPRPEVQVDVPMLIREQRDRATWMEQAIERAGQLAPTAWDEIVTTYDQWSRGVLRL